MAARCGVDRDVSDDRDRIRVVDGGGPRAHRKRHRRVGHAARVLNPVRERESSGEPGTRRECKRTVAVDLKRTARAEVDRGSSGIARDRTTEATTTEGHDVGQR